jgi:translocation and assembly module TamA
MKIYRIFLFIIFFVFHIGCYANVEFEIRGVENDDLKGNISLYLDALSQPKNATNETYLLKVNESVVEAMNAFGYYHSDVDINVTGELDSQLLTLDISPGQPIRITELDIKLIGEGELDPKFKSFYENFPLKINDILHHGKYENAKRQISNIAQRYGYFDSAFTKSSVEVTSKNNSATVTLWFESGIRYQFGELVFSNELPADYYIETLKNFETGDSFDSRILSKFNADINQTGYFKSVTILPEINNKQGRLIPLNVIASMRPKNSFNVGFGVSTDEGIRGKFRWNHPWVNDYGHSIEGNLVASIPEQEASLIYKMPLKDPLYNYLSVQTGYKLVNNNDTDTSQYLIGFNHHSKLSNNWLQTLSIRYDYEYGRQGQQDFSTQLLLPGFAYSRSMTRGGINANWGNKQLVSFEISDEVWGSSADLMKVFGQTKFLRTYHKHQFVAYGELGAIYTDSIYNVPSSMRFFTGGDQSIRGYEYESIAPTDDQGYLIGGLYLAVASLEYRYPITDKWKLAMFVEAGTAADDIIRDSLSIGTGIGAVWASPIGPVRLYIAKPQTGNPDVLDSITFHFMLGPEL